MKLKLIKRQSTDDNNQGIWEIGGNESAEGRYLNGVKTIEVEEEDVREHTSSTSTEIVEDVEVGESKVADVTEEVLSEKRKVIALWRRKHNNCNPKLFASGETVNGKRPEIVSFETRVEDKVINETKDKLLKIKVSKDSLVVEWFGKPLCFRRPRPFVNMIDRETIEKMKAPRGRLKLNSTFNIAYVDFNEVFLRKKAEEEAAGAGNPTKALSPIDVAWSLQNELTFKETTSKHNFVVRKPPPQCPLRPKTKKKPAEETKTPTMEVFGQDDFAWSPQQEPTFNETTLKHTSVVRKTPPHTLARPLKKKKPEEKNKIVTKVVGPSDIPGSPQQEPTFKKVTSPVHFTVTPKTSSRSPAILSTPELVPGCSPVSHKPPLALEPLSRCSPKRRKAPFAFEPLPGCSPVGPKKPSRSSAKHFAPEPPSGCSPVGPKKPSRSPVTPFAQEPLPGYFSESPKTPSRSPVTPIAPEPLSGCSPVSRKAPFAFEPLPGYSSVSPKAHPRNPAVVFELVPEPELNFPASPKTPPKSPATAFVSEPPPVCSPESPKTPQQTPVAPSVSELVPEINVSMSPRTPPLTHVAPSVSESHSISNMNNENDDDDDDDFELFADGDAEDLLAGLGDLDLPTTRFRKLY